MPDPPLGAVVRHGRQGVNPIGSQPRLQMLDQARQALLGTRPGGKELAIGRGGEG
jgi:hypothetical protein